MLERSTLSSCKSVKVKLYNHKIVIYFKACVKTGGVTYNCWYCTSTMWIKEENFFLILINLFFHLWSEIMNHKKEIKFLPKFLKRLWLQILMWFLQINQFIFLKHIYRGHSVLFCKRHWFAARQVDSVCERDSGELLNVIDQGELSVDYKSGL